LGEQPLLVAMKKTKREFLEAYNKIRKPMPPPDKVITPKVREDERWDWRRELEEIENEETEETKEEDNDDGHDII